MKEYKSKNMTILGYDLETTGVPEVKEKTYQIGENDIKMSENIVEGEIFDIYDVENNTIDINGHVFNIDYIKETDNEIKIKAGNYLMEISVNEDKTEKLIRHTTLPGVNSYGYISYEIETPEYILDDENKKITVKYKDKTGIIELNYDYKDIEYNFNRKTNTKEISSFTTHDNKQFIIKDSLIFERLIKSNKEVDKPMWNYFTNFEKKKENNLFFSIPDYIPAASPEATALTRLFQTNNLKQITDKTEIENWFERFFKKIKQEEPDMDFPYINLEQDSDKIWDDFETKFVKTYQANELSSYPMISKDTWSELLEEMEKADTIFGHNIIGFDNPLVAYDNMERYNNLSEKTFIDTMLIPIKTDGQLVVKNLNKAINDVVKNGKMFDEETKEYLIELQEERKRYHDALLDITGNFYPFAEQMQKIYTRPDTSDFTKIIQSHLPEILDKPVKNIPEINTLIGIATDDKGFSNIEKISNITKDSGYENVGISNYILHDFPIINEKLNENGKAIVNMKITFEGEEVIVVLKSPEDQVKLEILLEDNRELDLKELETLLNGTNTMEFLMKPTFENEYNLVSDKIGIRVDPFIDFDYDNTKFKNKRVLTVSPITDVNDIKRFMAGEVYKAIKRNGIMTGELDYLKLLSWNNKNILYGLPSKEDLGKIFPVSKYRDIYKNANEIGEKAINFDLYSSNKREEFPDMEKLFSFDLPKMTKEMEEKVVHYLNVAFKEENITFRHNEKKIFTINDPKIDKEKFKEVLKVSEELVEKVKWGKAIEDIEMKFKTSDRTKALHYNYILLDDYDINPHEVIEGFSSMDEETKISSLITYVEKNHNTPEMEEHLQRWEKNRNERRDEENRIFNEMKKGDVLNTSLSTFYHKYLMLNRFVQQDIYKDAGVEIGPGRGSAGGSEVAFELDITQVDPLRYDTLFFRFAHEYKTSKPDIDTDHSDRQGAIDAVEKFMELNYTDKQKMLDLLETSDEDIIPDQKYFKSILNIVYFTRKTMFKGLIKSLRVSAMNSKKLEINFKEDLTLRENIDAIDDARLRSYFDTVPGDLVDILDNNSRNLIRNLGKHASGNILFNNPYEKVYTAKGFIEDYGEDGDMPEKLDVLGLQTLEILLKFKISSTIEDVNNRYDLGLTTYQINNFIKKYETDKDFIQNLTEYGIENNISLEKINEKQVMSIYNSYNNDYLFTNYEDMDIMDMLKNQLSGGIFQMDAKTQKRLLNQILSMLEIGKIENLPSFKKMNTLTVMTMINAVNRPGPLMAGMGDEIIVNLRNDLLTDLHDANLLDKYNVNEDTKFLHRHIKKFEKNDYKTEEYYSSKRFNEFWDSNLDADMILINNNEMNSGLVFNLIQEGKTKEEIIEIFKNYEEEMKSRPEIKEILAPSNGAILYQEQIMQLAQELGGLTDEEADGLRKAVSKSNPVKIMEYINLFVKGAGEKGIISPEIAEYLGIKFKGFGSYAFNKAHSQAYSLIGYQSALQKSRNTPLFYATNFNFAKMEQVSGMIEEIEKNPDVNLITGSINTAVDMFTVSGEDIIIPLTSYKGLSESAASKVIQELTDGKPFVSLYDLFYRTQPDLDKRSFEVLLKSGLLNDFVHAEGLSVKTLSENVTTFFNLLKDYYLKENPPFVDIEKLEVSKVKLTEELLFLEDEKDRYHNPVQIEMQIEAINEKLNGKQGVVIKIEKALVKNEKLLIKAEEKLAKGEVNVDVSITDILNSTINAKKDRLRKIEINEEIKDIKKVIDVIENNRNKKITEIMTEKVTIKYPKQKTLYLKRKPEKQIEELREYSDSFQVKKIEQDLTDNVLTISDKDLDLIFKVVENLKQDENVNKRVEDFIKWIYKKENIEPTNKELSLMRIEVNSKIENKLGKIPGLTTSNLNLVDINDNDMGILIKVIKEAKKDTNIDNRIGDFIQWLYKKENLIPTNKELSLMRLEVEIKLVETIASMKNIIKDKEVLKKEIPGSTAGNKEKIISEVEEITQLQNNKSEYTINDFNENRYVLLKNFNTDNITVDVKKLEVFDEEKINKIMKYSSHQFDGENFIELNKALKEKYGYDFDNNMSEPLFIGKTPKMIMYVDYIPDEKDQTVNEFTSEGSTIIKWTDTEGNTYKLDDPNAQYKNYYILKEDGVTMDRTNSLSLSYDKDKGGLVVKSYGKLQDIEIETTTKEETTYYRVKDAPYANTFAPVNSEGEPDMDNSINMRFDKEIDDFRLFHYGKPQDTEITITGGKMNYLTYFEKVLTENGMTMDDIMVIPAFPFTKKQFKEVESNGTNIGYTDSMFTARFRNINEKSEIDFISLTDTMVNGVTKRWNLAGKESDISIGKPFIFKMGDQKVNTILLPTISMGLSFKSKEAIEGFGKILDLEGRKSEEVVIEDSSDRETKYDRQHEELLKKEEEVIDVEIITEKIEKKQSKGGSVCPHCGYGGNCMC